MAHKTYNEGISYDNTVFADKTANHTSSAHLCAGAKSISLYFDGEGTVTDRTGSLGVEISPDGSDWYDYKMLIVNQADSNAESIEHTQTISRITDGKDVLFFEPRALGSANYFRATLVVEDSGTGSPAGNFDLRSVVQY